jgi:hypothetical protein
MGDDLVEYANADYDGQEQRTRRLGLFAAVQRKLSISVGGRDLIIGRE